MSSVRGCAGCISVGTEADVLDVIFKVVLQVVVEVVLNAVLDVVIDIVLEIVFDVCTAHYNHLILVKKDVATSFFGQLFYCLLRLTLTKDILSFSFPFLIVFTN